MCFFCFLTPFAASRPGEATSVWPGIFNWPLPLKKMASQGHRSILKPSQHQWWGDCWLVSSFSALAEYPDRVRSLFKQNTLTEASHVGEFSWSKGLLSGVRFEVDGWQEDGGELVKSISFLAEFYLAHDLDLIKPNGHGSVGKVQGEWEWLGSGIQKTLGIDGNWIGMLPGRPLRHQTLLPSWGRMEGFLASKCGSFFKF